LRPGQIVIMDNLSSHKVAGIQDAIEAVGARLEYLPSYSPDLSPIEECWSKLKAILRAKAARTCERLDQAITEACDMITPQDGWLPVDSSRYGDVAFPNNGLIVWGEGTR